MELGNLDAARSRLTDFCRRHSLNHRRMRDGVDTLLRLLGELNSLKGRLPAHQGLLIYGAPIAVPDLLQHLVPLFSDAYSEFRLLLRGRSYVQPTTGHRYVLDEVNGVNNYIAKKPSELIALSIQEFVVDAGSTIRRVVTLNAPAGRVEVPVVVAAPSIPSVEEGDILDEIEAYNYGDDYG